MLGHPPDARIGRAEQPVPRLIGAAALIAAAVLHLLLVPGFALPVLYSLFAASAAGTLLGAALLLASAPRLGWLIGGGTAFLTFLGYVLTRTIGLPGILTSVGNWFYPLGAPSLVVEGVAFLLAGWALSDRYGLTAGRVRAELRSTAPAALSPSKRRHRPRR
ncbi:MAG TPA: hypothetical protein VJ757_16775 [Pseudonocardiaceae bacterium]|nr:hypothetical protein [Pseudonocardiaceae bacterium]